MGGGVSGIISTDMVIRKAVESKQRQVDLLSAEIDKKGDQTKILGEMMRSVSKVNQSLKNLTGIGSGYNARKADMSTTEHQGIGDPTRYVDVIMKGSERLGNEFDIGVQQRAKSSRVKIEFETDIKDKNEKLGLNYGFAAKVGVDENGKHIMSSVKFNPNDSAKTIERKLNQLFKANGNNYRAYAVGSEHKKLGIEIESVKTGNDVVKRSGPINKNDFVFIDAKKVENNDNVVKNNARNDDYSLNECDDEEKEISVSNNKTSHINSIIYDEDDECYNSDVEENIWVNDDLNHKGNIDDDIMYDSDFAVNPNNKDDRSESKIINDQTTLVSSSDESDNGSSYNLADDIIVKNMDDDNSRIRGLDDEYYHNDLNINNKEEFANYVNPKNDSLYALYTLGLNDIGITIKATNGQDSIIKLDGEMYTHHSNTYDGIIPNCVIKLKDENSIDEDTQEIHYQTIKPIRNQDKLAKDVKDFLNDFNELSDLHYQNVNPNIDATTDNNDYVLSNTAVLKQVGGVISLITNSVKRQNGDEVNSLGKLGIEWKQSTAEVNGKSFETWRLELVNPDKLSEEYERNEKVIENLFRDSISVESKSKEQTGSTLALVRMNDRLNSKLYCKPFNLKFDVKSINNNDDDNKPKISIENITLTTSEMKNGQRVEKAVYSTVKRFDNDGNEIENKNKDFAKCEFRNGYHYVEIMKGEYAGMRFTYIPGLVEKDFQEIYDITPQEGAGNRMQAALGTLVNSKNPTIGAIPDALKAGADQIAKDAKEQERLEGIIVDISDVLTGQINFINSITDMMLKVEQNVIKDILMPDSR
ncbi:MAG: hypothetical protein HRU35_06105 [Rickettsiaceae bacterium]|nr:hypothetical protein [Rickettsiaceae bacterium]